MAVEFSRDITFGQYLDLGSPIHRLDPRTKILAWGALMLATFLVRTSFAGYAVLVVAAALIQAVSRWWILSISTDGLRQGLVLLVRVVLLYYWTSTLMYTTPMMDLADGTEIMLDPIKRLRVPVNELVLVMVIAIRF